MGIRILPGELVDQIAAGEVIERPASVVKELVENALDAGATRIEIDVEGGALTPVRPAAHPPGTTIEVRDLFFNVPARRKFVRSDATELTHIARLVERLVLSRFDVSFRLRHGTRVLLDAPAVNGAGA